MDRKYYLTECNPYNFEHSFTESIWFLGHLCVYIYKKIVITIEEKPHGDT
jgi:hypothetical protein